MSAIVSLRGVTRAFPGGVAHADHLRRRAGLLEGFRYH